MRDILQFLILHDFFTFLYFYFPPFKKLSLKKLNNKCIKYSINYDTPDNHLYIMRTCRNLLVHKGGFSVIGALIFNGDNLYITGFFNPLNVTDNHNNNFFSHIKKYELV